MCWQSPWPTCDTLKCLVMCPVTAWLPCVLQRWVSAACRTFSICWMRPYCQGVLANGGIASCIHSPDINCNWVNICTPRPLYSLLSSAINPLKKKCVCFIEGLSPYRAVNTLILGYKKQSFNAVWGKSRCLFWDPYKTHKRNVGTT
jgi:hypothetical protein